MGKPVHLPLLDSVRIATPCHARWEEMEGDDRVRHCAECNLSVHNLSAMTRDEAEQVLRGLAHGRVCGAFHRRADGTILTQDCPVGLARVRAAARGGLVRLAALVGLVGAAGVAAGTMNRGTWGDRLRLRAVRPFNVVCEWIAPAAPAPVMRGQLVPGGLAWPISLVPSPPAPVGQQQSPSEGSDR